MKLPVNIANNLFKTKITAYDESVTELKGKTQTVTGADYTFSGTIQPASLKMTKMIREGQGVDIDLILHTTKKLSAFDATQGHVNATQSYVVDTHVNGLTSVRAVYKVIALGNWAKHISGSINKYGLEKYVNVNDNNQ